MRRKKVRVALIGIGNCAAALVQGVEFYRKAQEGDSVPGLMHVNLGGYRIADIDPNTTYRCAEVPELGVRLDRTCQLNFGGNTDFLNMPNASGSNPRSFPRPSSSPAPKPSSAARGRVRPPLRPEKGGSEET